MLERKIEEIPLNRIRELFVQLSEEIDLNTAKQFILKMSEEELNDIINLRYDYYILHHILWFVNPDIVNELCKFVIPKLKQKTLNEYVYEYIDGKEYKITALDITIEEGFLEVAEMLMSYMFKDSDLIIQPTKLKYERLISLKKELQKQCLNEK